MPLTDIIAKNLKNLDLKINREDYNFLDSNKNLKYPILIGLGGSHAYGTNIESSDIDVRGIAANNCDEILLGRDFEQVCNEKTDTTIYSLKKMLSLLANCNPNIIEFLGLKPEHYLYKTRAGLYLIKNKDIFLSNKCVSSFMGYANSQLYRMQQKTAHTMSKEDLNIHIANVIQSVKQSLLIKYNLNDINIFVKDGELKIDITAEDYPLLDLKNILSEFSKVIKEYNSNSKRNDYASNHNKISKHAMHLLRLYMMCEDILLYGKINTYRTKERDLLMRVRNGEFLDENQKMNKEFFEMVKDYENRLQKAKEHSILPEKPDYNKIERFAKNVNQSIILGENYWIENV